MKALVLVLACLAINAGVAAADEPASAATSMATDTISVLYRRETADGPERVAPAVQAATAALEKEFLARGFKVIQPTPDVYRLLDQGPTVVVTFAPDAGLSLLFSVYTNLRPMPGTEIGIAEVRIDARLFAGRSMLAVEQGRGQIQTRIDPALREYGLRRGYELAAQKAAAMLAPAVAQRLQGITAPQLAAYADIKTGSVAAEPVVAPHAAPTPSPQAATDSEVAHLPPPRERWAIIAGVSDYSSLQGVSASNLAGVTVDVANMQKALAGRGFSGDHIKVLLDSAATSRNLRGELKRLAGTTRPEDLVVLFISAHGAAKNFSPSGFGMPVLSDFSSSDNDLDFWEIQSLTRNLPAKQVVWIIDTCHAGGATSALPTVVMSSRGIVVDRSKGRPNVDTIRDAMSADRNFAVISAARAEESSLDLGARGGLFTLHFLAGLAQEQVNTTLEELFRDQVVNQVIRQSEEICKAKSACDAPRQTPVFGYSGSGNKIHL